MKQHNKPRKSCALFGLGFMEIIPSPRLGFLGGVFLANHAHPNLEKSARTLLHRSLGSSVRWPLSPNFFSLHCIEKDLSGEGQS